MRNTSETDYDVIKYNHMSAQAEPSGRCIKNNVCTEIACKKHKMTN